MKACALTVVVWMLMALTYAQQSFDLVVYGGTAGGVMAAVAGARQGLKTVLLESRQHVGGMATGGVVPHRYGHA